MSATPGALYGIRLNHVAALAATCREQQPLPDTSNTMRQVASYERHSGHPFRVIHDLTVNRPYGRFAVYIAERRVGAQLSFPSDSDCRRMESPPPLCAPYEQRLSKKVRMALGVLAPNKMRPPKDANGASVERGVRRGRIISALRKRRAKAERIEKAAAPKPAYRWVGERLVLTTEPETA